MNNRIDWLKLINEIIVTASVAITSLYRIKVAMQSAREAEQSSVSPSQNEKSRRLNVLVRLSFSFIALSYLLFYLLGPLRDKPACVGDVAGLAMMAALFVITTLDRP